MNITKQRAFPTIPNKNICLPIGTTLAVQYFFEKLNFSAIFGKYKSKGHDINSLLIGLLSYKLTENFSIKEASNWMNQGEAIGITVNKGNVLDLQHFPDTYNQVKSKLKKGSLIVFDKGANTKDNIELIEGDELRYSYR
ncbi:Mobile element protein [Methanosarcina siciliae C2J]|uniref:Mobile element protein n=1 Tax=Methanosarcina siciliae C2J TaxID=1434118 RepID=A0A0E3PNT2_9EURY|nr:Mobile element protein [Methanosarcina siciliae C2J]